jgi:glycerol-3-phosphate acyltransferase PlsY
MIVVFQIAFILLGYLSGSIPFGYYLTLKATGLNILEVGSGNIGSTNVRRIAGRKLSMVVQLLDMLKGILPVGLVLMVIHSGHLNLPFYTSYLVAFASIIGHNFSVFLRFRGGKGVNTTLGASVLLAPIPVFASVAIYFLVKWRFKFVSAGSMALAISLPLMAYLMNATSLTQLYLLICCFMILIRHAGNLKRLMEGKERA